MISELLKIVIPYCMGMIVTFLLVRPVKEWSEGYETAKKRYGSWSLGFEEGFDAGWDSASSIYRKENRR